jgi:hypothetical protein
MTELVEILKQNQHDASQPPHLSASSIALHMRCPRQWQLAYVFAERGEKSDALRLGSAVHTILEIALKGDDPRTWESLYRERESELLNSTIAREAEVMAYHYYETIGKHLPVVATEREILVSVPGVEIPVLGYIDIETIDRNIDIKTTRYFSRKGVRPNKEWRFQQGIYQLASPKPSEVHVITRAKSDPVVVPDSNSHPLHFGIVNAAQVVTTVQDEWNRMKYHWETYGENPWPGNPMHEWASKYCSLAASGTCCAL